MMLEAHMGSVEAPFGGGSKVDVKMLGINRFAPQIAAWNYTVRQF